MLMQLIRFDFNLLKALDALLIEKSVTRAAERVCLSQPAMSGALKRLRDELNDQLLVRVGREMELTPLAQALARSVPELVSSIQSVLDTKLSFDPATARRAFNFAMSDYASSVLLPDVLRRLNEEAPYITCHVQTVDATTLGGLLNGDIDLVLIGFPKWHELDESGSGAELLSELLFSDDFVCLVAADHPAISGALTVQQFSEFPHGIVRFGRVSNLAVEGAMHAAGCEYQVGLSAPNFVSLILMLPHTKLIATVPRRLALMLSRTLPLRVMESPIALPRLDEVLVWHPRAALDPAHDYFRSIVRASAQNLVGVNNSQPVAPVSA
jgi:LysR family nod box-dependent transcriptional activator